MSAIWQGILGYFRLGNKVLRYAVSCYVTVGFSLFLVISLLFGVLTIGTPIAIGWFITIVVGSTKGWAAIAFFVALIVIALPTLPAYMKMTALVLERVLMSLRVYSLLGIPDYTLREKVLKS